MNQKQASVVSVASNTSSPTFLRISWNPFHTSTCWGSKSYKKLKNKGNIRLLLDFFVTLQPWTWRQNDILPRGCYWQCLCQCLCCRPCMFTKGTTLQTKRVRNASPTIVTVTSVKQTPHSMPAYCASSFRWRSWLPPQWWSPLSLMYYDFAMPCCRVVCVQAVRDLSWQEDRRPYDCPRNEIHIINTLKK